MASCALRRTNRSGDDKAADPGHWTITNKKPGARMASGFGFWEDLEN
jgi:hypothetical protein